MDRVALVCCEDYERSRVEAAVKAVFEPFGGIKGIISPGMRVLIKLNLLMKRSPDRATTTHPEVARAIALEVKNAGGIPIFADSPGGPYTKGMLSGVYDVCGIRAVAHETGCALNEDFSTMSRYYEEGRVAKQLDLIGILGKVDAVITVGKLKTHGLTTMTGCVKNLYGTVPGTTKAEYHARYTAVDQFSEMLVDLCGCVKPCFAVMDAVVGMEGEGPSGGRPRAIGALIGGVNPHQVDEVGAKLIGIQPDLVTTLRAARARGLIDSYEIVGESLEPMIVPDFDVPMKLSRGNWLRLMNKVPQALRPRPVFTHRKCDGCGTCVRACPAKAIRLNADRKPQVDLNICIRCFCCQELCPKTDVDVKRPLIFKWLK